MVVGSDRVPNCVKKLLEQYNGKQKHGIYEFDKKVVVKVKRSMQRVLQECLHLK